MVVVSKGPDVVTMPDLTGMTFDDASATLTAAGFVPVLSFGAVEGSLQSASINGVPAEVGGVYRAARRSTWSTSDHYGAILRIGNGAGSIERTMT